MQGQPQPGKAKANRRPEERRDPYVPPRDELGTSDEVAQSGKQYYAAEKVPRWPEPAAPRQYIATPEEKQEIQHGLVTWIDAANSDKNENEDIDSREHRHRHRSRDVKPPGYEL